MRRRGLLKAIVAAAAGCLALAPKTRLVVVNPYRREDDPNTWYSELDGAPCEFDEHTDRSILARAQAAEDRRYGFGVIPNS